MLPRWIFIAATAALLAWGQDVTVEVRAASAASYRIPRTIYGTFLEPIGNSTYGGLWAEILENPSFEENLWNADRLRAKLAANPGFTRSTALGLPLPWEPLDGRQGARYEPRWGEAANSNRSLFLMALAEGETGIRQEVFLPVHRTVDYRGSVYLKHVAGPGRVEVSLRRRNQPGVVLASAAIESPETVWTKRAFTLRLEAGSVQALEPVDFVISAGGGARVLIDQAALRPADAVEGMDPEMIELSKALRTPLVRFGGNFTSAYHWKDGVGPMDQRVSMLNVAWGIPEYNQFGTDELLAFCRLIGAEPQIALNLGTGTPEEAAGWVSYVNRKWNGGRGGLYWELGNELWGNFQTGYPTLAGIADLTRDFASAVKRADPKARLIATGQDPDHFEKWNAEQLKNAGAFDYLATHFVVGTAGVKTKGASQEFVAESAFALPVGLERQLRAMKVQIEANPAAAGRVKLAFTEWLFHGRGQEAPAFGNQGGAICAAGMLNTLIRTADFTPISDMTGLIEFGGIWKKRGRVYGVPAYWAFRMYSTADATIPVEVRANGPSYDVADGNNRLPAIAGVPYLDIVAARNQAGDRLTLFCVNRHMTRDLEARIDVRGFEAGAPARVQTLAAGTIYDANSEAEPGKVAPVETWVKPGGGPLTHVFPRASVVVIELRK